MDFLQTQEILRRCFDNQTERIKVGSMGSAQDYFNAVYDESSDALRVNFGGESGVLYWEKPVANEEALPLTGREGEVRFVFTDDIGYQALYYFESDSWHKFTSENLSVFALIKEPTGFVNRVDSVITAAVVADKGQVTIAPVATSFQYTISGIVKTKSSAQMVELPDGEGIYFCYFDGLDNTLKYTTVFDLPLLTNHAVAVAAYWNATDKKFIGVGDERHGNLWPAILHWMVHKTMGAKYSIRDGGGTLGNIISDGDGSSDAHTQMSISDFIFFDEDIEHKSTLIPQQLTPILQAPVFWLEGTGESAVIRSKAADNFIVKNNAIGGALQYNKRTGSTWSVEDLTDHKYMCYHLFGINDKDDIVGSFMGNVEYANANIAVANARKEIETLASVSLVFREFIPIATIIFKYSSSYSNTSKAIIVSLDSENDYVSHLPTYTSPGQFLPGGDAASNIRIVDTYDANEILTPDNDMVICVDNEFTVTAYTAVGYKGRVLTIKNSKSNTNSITFDADGTETIDGELSWIMLSGNSMNVVSDGVNWIIF